MGRETNFSLRKFHVEDENEDKKQVVGVSPKPLRRGGDKKSRVEQRRTQVFGYAAHQQGETAL